MSGPVWAGVAIRFVPAGVVSLADGAAVLRATLVLSPIVGPDADTCAQQVDLTRWPEQIEAFLEAPDGLAVRIAPVLPGPDARPMPGDMPPVAARARRAVRWTPAQLRVRAGHVASLTTEWQTLVTGGDGGVTWNHLVAALTPRPPSPAAAGPALHPVPPPAPDVVATGGGALSLLLTLDRARSLLMRMADPRDTAALAPADPAFPRPEERLRTRGGDRKMQPWLPQAAPTPSVTTAPLPPTMSQDDRDQLDRDQQRVAADERSRVTNTMLQTPRKAAAKQHAARLAYRQAGTAAEARQALRQMAASKPSGVAPAAAAACAAGAECGPLQDTLDTVRLLHHAGSRADLRNTDTSQPPAPQDWIGDALALRRYFALQNDPTLARLFNLAVDVELAVDRPGLDHLLAGLACDEPGRITRFAFVTCTLGDGPASIWTTAKLCLWDRDPLFWACTREELDGRALGHSQADLLALGVISQFDGLMDLAAAQPDAAGPNPRFELATIDARRAAEADLHAESQAAGRGGLTAVGTLPSGGLLLLDRWSQSQALAQAADRTALTGPAVIDAEALTTGLRLDIGIDTGKGVAWRSLMDRNVQHGPPHFDAAMRLLLPDNAARMRLDAATLVSALRRRENEPVPADPKPAPSYFAEELLAHWQGAPLGLDLYGSTQVPATEGQGTPGRAGVLPLRQAFSLPRAGNRPPRQCFGWAVHVALRPQLAGGVVRPLNDAAGAYRDAPHHRFTLPPARPGVRGRRILRHERIEHPVLATPEQILRRSVPGPQETSTELVIRSLRKAGGSAAPTGPAATHRVFVPPPVAMAFADHHDVFSDARQETIGPRGASRTRPLGGLQDLAYDSRGYGTFPVWSTQQNSAGAPYPDDIPGRLPLPLPTGDAIFRPIDRRQDPRGRYHPFYPDPAAELMVFRLVLEDGSPVAGPSLILRVRRQGTAYPDVTPIAVEVVRAATGLHLDQVRLGLDVGGGRLVHGHDAWQTPSAPVFLDDGQVIHRAAGLGRVAASRVVVRLAPGERMQLDVWCLPRWETLDALFDIVESAAQIVQASGSEAGACLVGDAFCARLYALLPQTPPATIRQAMALAAKAHPGSQPSGPCGAGQSPLPGPAELATMAQLIHAAALDTVTPELAARTTVWVTHALDKPLRRPSFGSFGLDRDPGAEDRPGLVRFVGTVGLDRATTRFLEVSASAPGLVTGLFDDPRRGRSADDQARGIWPNDGEADGKTLWRSPGDVFGFDVEPDGCVTLRPEAATLLRIDPIAPVAEPLDLLTLEKSPSVRPHPIADSKARVLDIVLVAGSRTAPLMHQSDGTALLAGQQTLRSEPRRVLLPSTAAPARVSPLAVMPAFRLSQDGSDVTRTCRLRVRVRRPWFSAGAGERLGLVLWPPRLLGADRVVGDRVLRDYDIGSGEPDLDMTGFSDLDLGPGGEFVTRWGGDPTKAGPAPASWLVPPAAFTPLHARSRRPWTPLDTGADRDEVVYVPSALMPLPRNPDDAAAPSRTIAISLLAYMPRFDVDQELWYFDIAIDPAAAVAPFVRLGLVRYQANAPPGLRVSEPVVEWAQLYPGRTMAAAALPLKDGQYPVRVTITGVAAGADPSRTADAVLGPQMEITAYRQDADGLQTRLAGAWLARQPIGPAGSTWSDTLLLDQDPANPGPGARIVIVAAEYDIMRPANYPAEPFDPARAATDDVTTQSGPRFAAMIDLTTRGKHPAAEPEQATLPTHDGMT